MLDRQSVDLHEQALILPRLEALSGLAASSQVREAVLGVEATHKSLHPTTTTRCRQAGSLSNIEE